jgi:hypothetical protein
MVSKSTRLPFGVCLAMVMAASPALAAGRDRCGTRQVSEIEAAQVDERLKGYRAGNPGRGGAVTIPLWMHVISDGPGYENGDVPETMLREQVRVLNESFAGRTGGASSPFRFELAGVTGRRTPSGSTWGSRARPSAGPRRRCAREAPRR